MENALWNGKLINASDVSYNYSFEKEVRKASGHKELRCPDPECQNSTLRYCHGEIKDAFFAHLNNEKCDYSLFDRENTQISRTIRRAIYDSFKKKGYQVNQEVKVLDHHYSHLLFILNNGEQVALEFGTSQTSANRVDSLTAEYKKKNIEVKWVVIGNKDTPIRESHTFFLNRYLLNESVRRDLVVIDSNGQEIAQSKVDPNKYIYNGETFHSVNYLDTYTEYSKLEDLTFEEKELTIPGFHERYNSWLSRKQLAFNKKIARMKDDYEKRARESYLISIKPKAELRTKDMQSIGQPPSMDISLTSRTDTISKLQAANDQSESFIDYEKRRSSILPLINQQNEQVRDKLGYRWVRCETCGAIETEDKFVTYGGLNHINLGICYNCNK